MRKRERVPGVKQKSLNSLQSHFRPIEQLESRRLMAVDIGGVFDPDNVPVNTPTTTDLTDIKDGPLANAGQDLINLYRDYRRFMNAGGKESKFDKSLANPLVVKDARVALTVRGRDGVDALQTLLQNSGSTIIASSEALSAIQAFVPLSSLRSLASDGSVATINPVYRGNASSVGAAANQAEQTHLADQVRQIYGLDGRGIKIGIISTTVDVVGTGISQSIATGDLPADGIQIIEEGDPAGTFAQDEGRAMAELIHDIAPGAKLAFATGFNGLLDFADNVRALRDAGCTIIVDDINYSTESYFQPSVLDQAISEFTKGGGIYLSSAANYADGGYQDSLRFVKTGTTSYVDFDPGAAIDTRMRIDFQSVGAVLQWDNPYNGVAGNATADLDVYLYDPNYPKRVAYSFTTNNLKNGVPLELMSFRSGTYDMEIRLNGTTPGQPLPKLFKLFTRPDGGIAGIGSTEYSAQNRGTVIGHNGGIDTISVGAVPFYNVAPFGSTSPVNNENFSSFGPVTQVFDADGNRFTTPQTILKPDVSGVDGTNTSFFDGSGLDLLPGGGDIFNDPDSLPNFFGTSAAAPNVAAIVALMRQAASTATKDQILSALKGTARPLNGSSAGQFDPQGGYGLVDALAAVRQFVTAPTVRINDLKPSVNYGPISRLKIVFSQQVTGFDVSDLSLTRDGGPNLLTGDNNPQSTDGGRTYYVRNLSGITADPGTYTLELTNADLTVTNAIGLTLGTGDSSTFEIQPPPSQPADPSNLRGEALTSSSVRLRWDDNSNSESQFIIERAENAGFTQNLKLIRVTRDTTTYTDTGLNVGGKTLFYRVRAVSVAGDTSGYTNTVQVPTLTGGEVVLDNDSPGVTLSGSWLTRSSGSGFLGDNYLDDGGTGKSKFVRYTPTIQAAGEYYVYTRWTRSGSNATNVAVDVNAGGKSKQVTINQRKTGGSGWVLLGKYTFAKGKTSFVQINSAGADGRVVADAVRFLPADGGDIVTSAKQR